MTHIRSRIQHEYLENATHLRNQLAAKVVEYLRNNPEPTGTLSRLWDTKKEGRNRANKYLIDLNKTEENVLVLKVIRDFIIIDETSGLGSSNDLRSRIGVILCTYLNIEEKNIIEGIKRQAQISIKLALQNKEYRRIAIGALLLDKFNLTYEAIKDFDPNKTVEIALTENRR